MGGCRVWPAQVNNIHQYVITLLIKLLCSQKKREKNPPIDSYVS